eukprot:SAG31_NODE_6076_length_2180_cov_2.122537_2_plen_466_part_00
MRLRAATQALPIGRPSAKLAAAANALLKDKLATREKKDTELRNPAAQLSPTTMLPPPSQTSGPTNTPSHTRTAPNKPTEIAVLIVGLLRDFLHPRIFESQKHLLQPLQNEYERSGGIHLYICVDSPNAEGLRRKVIGETMEPTAVFEHTFEGKHNQWPRMSACYRDVQKFATGRGHWSGYRWIVRSRPDNLFFAPVPTLRDKAQDAVHGRVRRFGGYQKVEDEMMSWWHYEGKESVCGDQQQGITCVWHDTQKTAEGAQCVLLDDQFAYIPAGLLAAVYFGVPPVGMQKFRHFPLVHGNEKCQWPEGALTCRLLEAPGGRLEPMAVSFRIFAMTKLNGGKAPPTTHPREVPHVCVGAPKAGVQRPVRDWSVDDVLVWLVDNARVAGSYVEQRNFVDVRAKVVEQRLDGRQLISLLRKGVGTAGALAKVLGLDSLAQHSMMEQLRARLELAVNSLLRRRVGDDKST